MYINTYQSNKIFIFESLISPIDGALLIDLSTDQLLTLCTVAPLVWYALW